MISFLYFFVVDRGLFVDSETEPMECRFYYNFCRKKSLPALSTFFNKSYIFYHECIVTRDEVPAKGQVKKNNSLVIF